MRTIIATVLLTLIGMMLVMMVSEMPTFGQMGPSYNESTSHYLERSAQDTGSVNVISAIIMDYRAFDTLGEVTVLFSGVMAVIVTLAAHSRKGRD